MRDALRLRRSLLATLPKRPTRDPLPPERYVEGWSEQRDAERLAFAKLVECAHLAERPNWSAQRQRALQVFRALLDRGRGATPQDWRTCKRAAMRELMEGEAIDENRARELVSRLERLARAQRRLEQRVARGQELSPTAATNIAAQLAGVDARDLRRHVAARREPHFAEVDDRGRFDRQPRARKK